MTGAAVGSAGSGAGMRARDESVPAGTERGRAAADQAGVEEIERTSGRDVPMGGGGAAGKTGGGGKGGAGGTASKP